MVVEFMMSMMMMGFRFSLGDDFKNILINSYSQLLMYSTPYETSYQLLLEFQDGKMVIFYLKLSTYSETRMQAVLQVGGPKAPPPPRK